MAATTIVKVKKRHTGLYIAIGVIVVLALWQRKQIAKWLQNTKSVLMGGQKAPTDAFEWEYAECAPEKINLNMPLKQGMTETCEVGVLQTLLNQYANANLVLNGNYDDTTVQVLTATGIGTTPRSLNQFSPLLKQLK